MSRARTVVFVECLRRRHAVGYTVMTKTGTRNEVIRISIRVLPLRDA